MSLSLCCRLQSSGPSLTTPLPSPSSTYTGKVSVVSKVVGRLLANKPTPAKEERGPVKMAWLPSSVRHLLPPRAWLSQREGMGWRWGLSWEEMPRGSGENFSHNASPLLGYLSLSKVVPFSHYAGTLLLLLAGVACLRGRSRGSLVLELAFTG